MTALPTNADLATRPSTHGAVRAALAAIRDFLAFVLGEDGTIATALAHLGVPLARFAAATAATTLTDADRGKLLSATGTWALTLPGAAAVGAGWTVIVKNAGTGVITLTPAGSDLVDGSATIDLPAGRAAVIMSTGTGWITLALQFGTATGATAGLMAAADKTALTALATAAVTAVAGLTPAANKAVYYTSASTAALMDVTPFARSLLDDTDAAAVKATLGLTGALLLSNVNGTASIDSAGVATGAILEEGVNKDGRWTKFANGWMVCTRDALILGRCTTADGSAYKTANVNWTFPVPFVTPPTVSGVAADIDLSIRAGAVTTTGVTVRGQSQTSKSVILSGAVTAIGRWASVGAASPAAISPKFWYDPSDVSTLFQDDAGTVPVTQPGDPVGKMLDKSGNGFHLTQTNSARRPLWQLDSDGRAYLQFSGTGQNLQNASVTFGASEVTLFAACRKDVAVSSQNIVELNTDYANAAGSFRISGYNAADQFRLASYGNSSSTYAELYVTGGASPVVLTLQASIAAPSLKARRQGVLQSETTTSQASGTYTSSMLVIGARSAGTFSLTGRIYGVIAYPALLVAADVKAVEDWLNQRCGAF